MSKLTEKFREKRVYNPYEFYGELEPYIVYHPSRPFHSANWAVIKRGVNMGRAWYDDGCRTFRGFGMPGEGTRRARALLEAQAWASEKFGIKEWARDPFGSYGEAEFVKRRIKELK